MENQTITDAQITASSFADSLHAASHARLNFQEIPGVPLTGPWADHVGDVIPWLQVDLGAWHSKVTRVATQGGNSLDYPQWVTKYRLQYRDQGKQFQFYREPGQDTDEVKSLTIQ